MSPKGKGGGCCGGGGRQGGGKGKGDCDGHGKGKGQGKDGGCCGGHGKRQGDCDRDQPDDQDDQPEEDEETETCGGACLTAPHDVSGGNCIRCNRYNRSNDQIYCFACALVLNRCPYCGLKRY
jgi:hypothetical protein